MLSMLISYFYMSEGNDEIRSSQEKYYVLCHQSLVFLLNSKFVVLRKLIKNLGKLSLNAFVNY